MYMLEGFRLKCVFTSINDSFFSLFVLCLGIQPGLKKLSQCQIASAVNFIASRAERAPSSTCGLVDVIGRSWFSSFYA